MRSLPAFNIYSISPSHSKGSNLDLSPPLGVILFRRLRGHESTDDTCKHAHGFHLTPILQAAPTCAAVHAAISAAAQCLRSCKRSHVRVAKLVQHCASRWWLIATQCPKYPDETFRQPCPLL